MSQIGFYLMEILNRGWYERTPTGANVADSFSVFSEFSVLIKNFISRFENVRFLLTYYPRCQRIDEYCFSFGCYILCSGQLLRWVCKSCLFCLRLGVWHVELWFRRFF